MLFGKLVPGNYIFQFVLNELNFVKFERSYNYFKVENIRKTQN